MQNRTALCVPRVMRVTELAIGIALRRSPRSDPNAWQIAGDLAYDLGRAANPSIANLGMAFADERIVEVLSRIKYPYNLSVLTLQKALELLINEEKRSEWVKILLDEDARIGLMIIGDGPKQAVLQEEARALGIEDHVEFMGFRSNAAAFLKTFDAFVLPSHMEGIPRCIMESMAAGIPVVASDIPGNRNLVAHKDTGLLFAAGKCRDLARQISFLMDNPPEAVAMAAKARQKVNAEFSSRKMASEYTALYHQLLKR